MGVDTALFHRLQQEVAAKGATLVAVSKTKPVSDIMALYEAGQRDFGENYVQELVAKEAELPKDIRWHFIGHLQSNKVKYIAPFVHLIHGVDSLKLLQTIHAQGVRHNRVISCLLQVHIASEETKFGFDEESLKAMLQETSGGNSLNHVSIAGLMGMASFSADRSQVSAEFHRLKVLFDLVKQTWFQDSTSFRELSMGMSGDYDLALSEGSTLLRIGSLLFGAR